ncbi:MAG: HAMP domain-containing histidine kinase, partial [Gemmatimonadaceae bacterium]|nr:HAMP domain-containing histidine kinase [Gemmatimonadaceae bacterium]
MTARPRWLTTGRAWTLGALGVIGVSAIVGNHRLSKQRFLAQYAQALPISAALSAENLSDWFSTRAQQADVLARLMTSPEAERALSTLVDEGRYVGAQLIDAPHDFQRLRARELNDSVMAVEFLAPVEARSTTARWLVLTAVVTEATLPHFNVASPDDRTQRTSLYLLEADSARLLASSAPGGMPHVPIGAASVAKGLDRSGLAHRVFDSSSVSATAETGRGLSGRTVMFTHARLPGTALLLVREREVDELLSLVGPSLLVTDGVFGVLLLLVLGVLAMVWRTTYLRRENEAVQVRSAFVSSVSHELRTPLTQIRMYAEMLRLRVLTTPAETERALSVIEKESERLSMLVERSLTYTRTGTLPVPTEVPTLQLPTAVREAIAVVTPLAHERGNVVVADVPDDVTVHVDRDALQQILLNLLDNAIKYGPHEQQIRIVGRQEGSCTRITVEDNGPGVPADEHESIWNAFSRGSSGVASAEMGSGIGLAVVRDLATRAGGK